MIEFPYGKYGLEFMANPSIRSKADRKKLTARREPYWARIRNGCYIGFRAMGSGEGTWIARWRNEDGKHRYKALGHFEAYDAAVKKAASWFDQNKIGIDPGGGTVEEACQAYVDHLGIQKGEKTAIDAEGRLRRLVYGKKIGCTPLNKLRSTQVRSWLNAQIEINDEDPESLRKAKASANRNLTCLKSALNLALKNHLVSTDIGWKSVNRFPKTARNREHFLTLDERNRLLNACPHDLREFVKALLATAGRPGEIASCKIQDFDRKNGTLVLDGKTGRRLVSLSSNAVELFINASKGKIGNAPLVAREDGSLWNKDAWKRPFKRAVSAAGLPSEFVIYSLRHIAISEMIASGVDAFTVARLAGTSTTMIDKHYGHLMHSRVREKLDQARMFD